MNAESGGRDPYALEREENATDPPRAAPARRPPIQPRAESHQSAAQEGFTIEEDGEVMVITLTDQSIVDSAYIQRLGERILQTTRGRESPRIVADLTGVEHLSSAALGMFLTLRKDIIESRGGKLALAGIRDDLMSVFKLTKLDRIFTIHQTREAAIRVARRSEP